MANGYNGIPATSLETPLGVIEVHAHSTTRLTVRELRGVDSQGHSVGHITINGVDYGFMMYLELREGEWQLQIDPATGSAWRSTYGTRSCWNGNWNTMNLTDAARKKLDGTVIPIVAEWAKANRPVLVAGELASLKAELSGKRADERKLLDELRGVEEQMAALDAHILRLTVELEQGQQALEVAA